MGITLACLNAFGKIVFVYEKIVSVGNSNSYDVCTHFNNFAI